MPCRSVCGHCVAQEVMGKLNAELLNDRVKYEQLVHLDLLSCSQQSSERLTRKVGMPRTTVPLAAIVVKVILIRYRDPGHYTENTIVSTRYSMAGATGATTVVTKTTSPSELETWNRTNAIAIRKLIDRLKTCTVAFRLE